MNKFIALGTVIILILLTSCTKKGIESPTELSISEGFVNPVGFYDNTPVFSWKLPVNDDIKSQSAYSIVVASDPKLLPGKADLWSSGKTESGQSVWLEYKGTELNSRQKAYWQVRYWDQDGNPSQWSETAHFELGLLKNEDWKAKWINIPEKDEPDTTEFGNILYLPQYIRNEFEVKYPIQQARLYVTSKGVFEAQLNGEKVGDDIMPPGWTPYKKRIETLTYDVTQQINEGTNCMGFILSTGWHSGRLGFKRDLWVKDNSPGIIGQLEIHYTNGEKDIFITEEGWKATNDGPIRFSGIYDGEVYDANFKLEGWNLPGYDDNKWEEVDAKDIDPKVQLLPKRHNTVKNQMELEPIEITKPDPGIVIFDLGQNMVGVPRLKIPMKKGEELKIRFAEMLQQDGRMYTENYRSAKSTDFYTADEDGSIDWVPKFTFHGFRYVEISGFDDNFSPEKTWLTGLVQYSDFDQNGSFTSSHEKLNKLQSNIIWGLRGNFFDIPTDCPQRDERLGWTGDAQVFAPTSIYNADVYSFWASWLQSAREEHFENGGIPFVIPNILGNGVSSGWGDAVTVIPWEIYMRTGDKNVLSDNYEMMKRWVAFNQSKATNHIVDIHSFSDWLQPYSSNGTRGDTPRLLINTAYHARSIWLTMKTAEALGEYEEAKEYSDLFHEVKKAFELEFFNEDGKLKVAETQTAYLMALGFMLLSEESYPKAIPNLIAKINEADNHLRTGFLGTPLLAPVLEKLNRTDLMYEILFKESYPSWFYSINQGATTMWERWNSYSHEDGFGNAGMNSFNHYAYGAIGQWMYERIAGISPLEPGYKKIRIAPLPGGPLTSAKGEYDSPYGKIISDWKIENGTFFLDVVIPPNTSAQIILPSGDIDKLVINEEKTEQSEVVTLYEIMDDKITIEVKSGQYQLKLEAL